MNKKRRVQRSSFCFIPERILKMKKSEFCGWLEEKLKFGGHQTEYVINRMSVVSFGFELITCEHFHNITG